MVSLSELVNRTRTGDPAARIEFFDRLRPYVRALTGAPDCLPAGASAQLDASDLTHNVLIRITQFLPDYRGSSDQQLRAWIAAIIYRQAIDDLRRLKPAVSLDHNGESAGQNGHPVADGSTASEKLLRAERILQVAEALEQLPDDQRQAVRLRHHEGLSLEEIGRRLGNRSSDAAGQLVHRGMSRLREILSRHQ